MNSLPMLTKRLVLVCLLFVISACASVDSKSTVAATVEAAVSAYVAVETAPEAARVLADYLAGNDAAQVKMLVHIEALTELHTELDAVDSGMAMVDFVKENLDHVALFNYHWTSLVAIVNLHAQTLGADKPMPKELTEYSRTVNQARDAMGRAIEFGDRRSKVRDYTELILKVLAARSGVIL